MIKQYAFYLLLKHPATVIEVIFDLAMVGNLSFQQEAFEGNNQERSSFNFLYKHDSKCLSSVCLSFRKIGIIFCISGISLSNYNCYSKNYLLFHLLCPFFLPFCYNENWKIQLTPSALTSEITRECYHYQKIYFKYYLPIFHQRYRRRNRNNMLVPQM